MLISAAVRDIVVEILFRDLEYLLDKYMTDMRKVSVYVPDHCMVFVSNAASCDFEHRASAGCIGTTNWTHTRANASLHRVSICT